MLYAKREATTRLSAKASVHLEKVVVDKVTDRVMIPCGTVQNGYCPAVKTRDARSVSSRRRRLRKSLRILRLEVMWRFSLSRL